MSAEAILTKLKVRSKILLFQGSKVRQMVFRATLKEIYLNPKHVSDHHLVARSRFST